MVTILLRQTEQPLLGADNKAGVAEIMTAIAYLIANLNIKHGDICIGFTI